MRLCFLSVLTIFLSAEANPTVSGAGRVADAKSGKDSADAPECTSGQEKKLGESVTCTCYIGNWRCTGFKKPPIYHADAKSGNDYADAPECTSGQTKKLGESVTCHCSLGNWRCTGFKKPPFHHADAKSGNDYADAPECTSGQTMKEGSLTCHCSLGNWRCTGFKKPPIFHADAKSGKDYADEPECTSGQKKGQGCATCTCVSGTWLCTGFCEPGNDYSDDYPPPTARKLSTQLMTIDDMVTDIIVAKEAKATNDDNAAIDIGSDEDKIEEGNKIGQQLADEIWNKIKSMMTEEESTQMKSDGAVDLEEFKTMLDKGGLKHSPSIIRKFNELDTNKNGKLEESEIKTDTDGEAILGECFKAVIGAIAKPLAKEAIGAPRYKIPIPEQGNDYSDDYSMDYPPPSAQDFANPMPEESQGNDYTFNLKLLCETLINPAIKQLCAMLEDKPKPQ